MTEGSGQPGADASWPPPGASDTTSRRPPPPPRDPSPPPHVPPPAPPVPPPRPASRPSALDAVILPIWLLLGQVLAGIALLPLVLGFGGPAFTEDVFVATTVVIGWGLVAAGTWLWLWRRRAWRREWGRGHAPWRWPLAAVTGVGAGLAGLILVAVVVAVIAQLAGTEPPEQEIFDLLDDPTVALLVSAVAVLVAPVVEEIVFRGVMLDVLARRMSWGMAAVVQAALFSAIHLETLVSPTMFLALGLLGFLFAWLRRLTGSLIAPIAAHLAFNAVSLGVNLAL